MPQPAWVGYSWLIGLKAGDNKKKVWNIHYLLNVGQTLRHGWFPECFVPQG